MNRHAAGLESLPAVIDVGLFIMIFALVFLCALFINSAELMLLGGLAVIVICVGIYLGEPKARAIIVIILPMALLLLFIYFFG